MDSSVGKQKDPCLMKTHFLKPYVTSIDGPVAELPRRRRVSVSSSSILKVLSSRDSNNGFVYPDRNLISWTRKMETLHEPIWKKAGIFEAIKASTHRIHKNPSLIQALVEKWCPETKSFVFSWGEATVTLEDVMVLLGFSVLGSPVFASVESSEMRGAVKKLEKAREKIMGGKGGQVSQFQWTSRFRDRDDSLEHEAFLALWLSHFVFPHMSRCSVSRNVLPIAVRLARGERIALAPAVLASLYRDLALGRICAIRGDESYRPKSVLKLVQVWIWERFKNLRPEPGEIPKGEPRIAQWSLLKQRCDSDERFSFDEFDWRPYTKPLQNWNPLRFYVEDAVWVTVDNNLDDEFVAFAKCVRSSQLVGIGFVEDYYPNRVAMQFGFSQDLPGVVTHHSNFTEKEAWDDYNKSLDGLKLYMPSRLAIGSVTTRYRDWWSKSVSEFMCYEEAHETYNARNTVGDDASPEVLPLSEVLQKLGEGFPAKFKRSRKLRIARRMGSEIKKFQAGDCGASVSVEMTLSEHLGEKRGKRDREDDDENHMDSYDDITIAQLVKCRKKDGGDVSGSLGIRRRDKDDINDSRICHELASRGDETVARQEIEPGDCSASVSVDVPLSELFHKELAKRTIEHLKDKRGQRAGEDDDENGMGSYNDITISQLVKSRKKDGGEASGSFGRRRDKEYNNDTRICQGLASGDDETVYKSELAKRTSEHLRDKRAHEDDDENHMDSYNDITIAQLVKSRKKDGGDASGSLGIRSRDNKDNNDSRICQELASGDDETLAPQEVEKPCVGQTCVDASRSNNPEKKKTLVEDVGDTSESLGRSRDKEYNNDSRICRELASEDDESVSPQVIEPQTEENDEEETRSESEEITVVIPSAGDTLRPPPEKKRTLVDDGTKEAECLLHEDGEKQRFNEKEEDETLKQRRKELVLDLEARFVKVEKTLATIRNWKTKRNHNLTRLSA